MHNLHYIMLPSIMLVVHIQAMDLPSPKKRLKEEAWQMAAEYLIEQEREYKKMADEAARLSKHNPDIDREVRASHSEYTAQADTSSIDPVFKGDIFIRQEVDTSPIWIAETGDRAVIYANHRVFIMYLQNQQQKRGLQRIFPLYNPLPVKAIAQVSEDQVLLGDTKGNICLGCAYQGNKKIAAVSGEVHSLVWHGGKKVIGVQYMSSDVAGLPVPAAAVVINVPLEEQDVQDAQVLEFNDDHPIKEISFVDDDHVVTQDFGGRKRTWKIDYKAKKLQQVV